MNEAPTERISPTMGWFMVGVALAFDLLKFVIAITIFIPIIGLGTWFLGVAIGWFASFALGFWLFFKLGKSFLTFRSASLFGAVLGDSIPVANMGFWNTWAVWYLVRKTQKEDRKKIAAYTAEQERQMYPGGLPGRA